MCGEQERETWAVLDRMAQPRDGRAGMSCPVETVHVNACTCTQVSVQTSKQFYSPKGPSAHSSGIREQRVQLHKTSISDNNVRNNNITTNHLSCASHSVRRLRCTLMISSLHNNRVELALILPHFREESRLREGKLLAQGHTAVRGNARI